MNDVARPTTLSPPERARQLIKQGLDIDTIAERLNRNRETVRNWLQSTGGRWYQSTQRQSASRLAVDADYEKLRSTIPPDTRSIGARLMGDPVEGRSALDKRNAQQRGNWE